MRFAALLVALALAPAPLAADECGDLFDGARRDTPFLPCVLGAQVDIIGQNLWPMTSPYEGPNSLPGDGDHGVTQAYGLYLGSRLAQGLEAYLDVEMARGKAIGAGAGLGSLSNGDILRQGSGDLSKGPVVVRAFLRWTVALGAETQDAVRGMDQLPGPLAKDRLTFWGGKLAASDLFDTNSFANNGRTQFLAWSLFNETAWDYAADTRGYTWGLAGEWRHGSWTVALARYLMPTEANGNAFDTDIAHAHGDNLQVAWNAPTRTVVRLLAWQNHARMGNYREALAQAEGGVPDVTATRTVGRAKAGAALNLEQPLDDAGTAGLFLRAGWCDGGVESFAYAEVDRAVSAGVQGHGPAGRRDDRWGIGVALEGLSNAHSDYLAAGGKGFLLGDGALRYGTEAWLEGYYAAALLRWLVVTPDLQLVRNPGYNRDRGPAFFGAIRLRASY